VSHAIQHIIIKQVKKMSDQTTNHTTRQLTHTTEGLYFQLGNIQHRVKELQQGNDYISVVFFVKDSKDQETHKRVTRTEFIYSNPEVL
jgi:hypothetical protein